MAEVVRTDYTPKSSFLDDLQVLKAMWFGNIKGGSHQDQLESFYNKQVSALSLSLSLSLSFSFFFFPLEISAFHFYFFVFHFSCSKEVKSFNYTVHESSR